jgi:hypothetical protein
MSYDSGKQLLQARGLEPMSNWHPPVMAYLWRYCDLVVAGPFLMLVIQSVCLLAGMYLVLRRVLAQRAAAVAAVAILLSPPVLSPMGVIWKDSQLAGFLMLAIGVMISRRRAAQLAGCALVWLATAQRYNAAAATLPVLLALFTWDASHSRRRRYALATAAWIGITATSVLANDVLCERKEYVAASLALLDISGIVRYAHDYRDEDILRDAPGVPWVRTDQIQRRTREAYHPTSNWLDLCGPTGILRYPSSDDQNAAVLAGWRHLIVKHPLAYLEHRFAVFFSELRLVHRHAFYLWASFSDSPETAQQLGGVGTHSWVQTAWISLVMMLSNTPVYWAWIYFVAAIVLLVASRRDPVALAVLASGICCELGLFIAAPAIDYRYSHWMVTCTIVGAVYRLAACRRSASQPA